MLSITTYDKKWMPAFIELNREWIENHFVIERMDLLQLEHAEEEILRKGGEIFFLLADDHVVGTCAMVPHGPDCYELAKMAVDRKQRGHGYGDVLMIEAIRWARTKGAAKIMLLSNTVLTPAITLYKKHGFETVHLGQHPDYERSNIEMELILGPEESPSARDNQKENA
jgi:GNAT superfamily N-acetyltransferase